MIIVIIEQIILIQQISFEFQIAKHFVNSNLKFAIANEEEFADEIKSLGFEDSGEDVSVGCFTEKQKFRMKPTEEFEVEDLVSYRQNILSFTIYSLVNKSTSV